MRRMFVVATLYWVTLCQARQNIQTTPQGDPSHFESKVNVVLVPVLVRDAHDQAVGELKKEDFQIFDNNKLQTLTAFTVQKSALASRLSDIQAVSSTSTAAATDSKALVPDRFIVFLFDDLHLSSSDLTQAQEASTQMLAESLSDKTAAAVFSISGATNSGLTLDRAKLADSIRSVRPQSVYRQIGHQCPDLDYYQSELILTKNDDQALQSAVQETIACSAMRKEAAEQRVRAAASQALNLGAQSTQVTLAMMKFIVRKMATLPGQRTLILISPGFLTMDALYEKSELIDIAAQANVTISALNARGLYVNELPASAPLSSSTELLRMKSTSYRSSALAGEDVMAELAYGTGGSYFHNSNDLSSGFKQLTHAPEYLYVLEFVPQDKTQDGSYHRLKVIVNQEALKVRARQGYYAVKASKKK